MEYLSAADERVKKLFLLAIKEAVVKLALTVDVAVKDADVRWLLSIDDGYETPNAQNIA